MSHSELPLILSPARLISYELMPGHLEPPGDDDGLATGIELLQISASEADITILVTIRLSRTYASGFADLAHAATVVAEQPDSGRLMRLRTRDPRKRYPPTTKPAYAPALADPRRTGSVTAFVVVPCLLDRTLVHGNLFVTSYLHLLRSNTMMIDFDRSVITSYRNDRPEEPQLADA